jgi:uncharacterized tellurite resistance protein B-like protein
MKIMDKLRNLLVMAASDGSFTEREMKYLSDRCQTWGLRESAFAEAVEHALSGDAELVLPPREEDRVEMLEDLMAMMAADGHLAETERRLFAIAAARMGISEARLNEMIDQLTKHA